MRSSNLYQIVVALAAVGALTLVVANCGDDGESHQCATSSDCDRGQVCDRGECVAQGGGGDTGVNNDGGGNNPTDCAGARDPLAGDLILNEILAAVPGEDTGFGDVNQDGVRSSSDDEFFEFYNASGELLRTAGVRIYKGGSADALLSIETGCLQPGQALVLFGGLEEGANVPTFPEAVVEIAAKSFGLTNSGTSIKVESATGEVLYDTFDFPGTTDQSVTLSPQLSDGTNYVPHTSEGGAPHSPGTCADGAALATGCPGAGPACPGAEAPNANNLIINEVLTNPPNDPVTGDVNLDGTRDSGEDEFVEIVNIGSSMVNVSGVTIAKDGSVKATLTTSCLQPGQGLVVFGGLQAGATPPAFGSTVVEIADSKFSWTNGGGSQLTVQGPDGNAIADFVLPTSGAESLTLSTQLTPGSDYVAHTVLNPGAIYSPGACPDGSAFADGCPEVMGEDPPGDAGDTGMDMDADTGNGECDGAGAPAASNLVLNEIFGDVPNDLTGDANGDGVRDNAFADEFVELWNSGGGLLSIEGVELYKGSTVVHTFTGCLPADTGLVLFGGLTDGATPPSYPSMRTVISTRGSGFGFTNGGTDYVLQDAGGNVIAQFSTAANPGASEVRVPELSNSSSLVLHNSDAGVTEALFSPGTCRDGSALTTGCP